MNKRQAKKYEKKINATVEEHKSEEISKTKRIKAQKDAKAKIDELLLMPNTKSVSISEDGTNSVNVDGHRIIPL